jgi:hypothetical protein
MALVSSRIWLEICSSFRFAAPPPDRIRVDIDVALQKSRAPGIFRGVSGSAEYAVQTDTSGEPQDVIFGRPAGKEWRSVSLQRPEACSP